VKSSVTVPVGSSRIAPRGYSGQRGAGRPSSRSSGARFSEIRTGSNRSMCEKASIRTPRSYSYGYRIELIERS
jgi:hypothetical protein